MKMPSLTVRTLLASTALVVVTGLPAMAQTVQTPATKPATPTTQTPATTAPATTPAKDDPKKAATPAQATTGTATATEEPVETVTVTAAKPLTKIDRDIYDPKTDPDTPTSSAADALNKAPGVNVDPEGNVTLRGNSGVQILIDGKPSPMVQGDFRAITLQSLPADDIDSIEVMTSPSAEFGSEGGAGIINIVMKRNRTLKPTLGMRFNVGSEGRYGLGANGGYGKGKVVFNGGFNVNHDARNSASSTERERISSGGNSTFTSDSEGRRETDTYNLLAGFTINATDKDQLGGQFTLNDNTQNNTTRENTEDRNGSGVLTSTYMRHGDNETEQNQGSARLNFTHQGDKEGETFKADLRLSGNERSSDQFYDYVYMDSTKDKKTQRVQTTSQKTLALSADYNRRIWGGTLATGFDINTNHSESDYTQYNIDLTSGALTIDTARSNAFVQDQDQLEAYVTYQRAFGEKWTLLSGLRAENTQVTLNQKTTSTYVDTSYTNYHPSLAIQYLLSTRQKVRYNYSHRINRPQVNDLNPYVVYSDERNARSGNPDLKPSETHGNDVRYEFNDRAKNITFTATAFYRKSENLFVDRSVYIDNNTVLLTRRENGGEGKETGLELMYNGKIGTKLDLNVQATYKQDERPPRSSTVTTITKADSISGRMRVNYRFTALDQFQITLNAQGKQLTGQGYTEPSYNWNASYGRKINNKLRFTVSAQDQGKRRSIIDTDTVRSVMESSQGGTTFMIGLQFNPFGIGGGGREGGMRMGGQGGGNFGGQGGGQGGGMGGGGGGGNNPGGGF